MANTFVFEDDDQQQPDLGNEPAPTEEPQPEDGGEKSNRTFLIAAIVLGGIVLLSLVCMAVYALVILPRQNQAKIAAEATNAVVASFSTTTAVVDQLTQAAALFTPVPPPTETPLPSPTVTPVIFVSTATSPAVTLEAGTATQEALLTQLAISNSAATQSAQLTAKAVGPLPTGPAGTAAAKAATQTAAAKMPKSGFADEVGLPGLFGVALVLVAVILLARRLRAAPLRN
jgi:hypothetical protein